jgi:hypothetical protein
MELRQLVAMVAQALAQALQAQECFMRAVVVVLHINHRQLLLLVLALLVAVMVVHTTQIYHQQPQLQTQVVVAVAMNEELMQLVLTAVPASSSFVTQQTLTPRHH